MKIEVVAIETSGLDPSKEIILEAAVCRFDTETGAHEGYQHSPIDPGKFNLSPEIVQFHSKTGLIPALLKERVPIEKAALWLRPADLRIVWALDFARPFLQASLMKAAVSNAIDAGATLELARALRGLTVKGKPDRALIKVGAIISALRILRDPKAEM